MKKNLLLLIAAAMTVTVAVKGEAPMTAAVPFAFRAWKTNLEAGKYMIMKLPKNPSVVNIQDLGSKKSIFMLADNAIDTGRGKPRLVFYCGNQNGCELAEAYDGSGNGWKFRRSREAGRDKVQQVAVIFLNHAEGE